MKIAHAKIGLLFGSFVVLLTILGISIGILLKIKDDSGSTLIQNVNSENKTTISLMVTSTQSLMTITTAQQAHCPNLVKSDLQLASWDNSYDKVGFK